HVLVVDIVDLLDAEAAHLLAAEILLLLSGNCLVAARGPLSRAARSSFGFWHGLSLRPRHPRQYGRRFRHLLSQRRLCRPGRRSRGPGRRAPRRPLIPVLLALFEALEALVNTHRQKLQDHVRYAQAAFQLLNRGRFRGELEQHIGAFPVLVNPVSQPALAPFIHFVYRGSGRGQLRPQSLYELIDLLVRRIRFYDEQLFVNPGHASSLFKPGARRLNFVMAFSTPSAIMVRTESAA